MKPLKVKALAGTEEDSQESFGFKNQIRFVHRAHFSLMSTAEPPCRTPWRPPRRTSATISLWMVPLYRVTGTTSFQRRTVGTVGGIFGETDDR